MPVHPATNLQRKLGNQGAQRLLQPRLGAGEPIPETTRTDFEQRFGADFHDVRIHRDSDAGALADRMSARAFAFDRDIVFGAGEYQPHSPGGRRLLAHELAHTLQPGRVVRRIVKHWNRLEDLLTRGLRDWAITDDDAHQAIQILKSLNDADLRDTVAAMEREGLVDNLFSNVSDDDQILEADALEHINEFRVHKEKKGQVGLVGACDAKHKRAIDDRVAATKSWAKTAKEAVNAFVADPAGHADTGRLLDLHFFHQHNAGPLTVDQQRANAQIIADNFELVELQLHPVLATCASPFDALCRSGFLAYFSRHKQRVLFCKQYFDDGEDMQTYELFHELTHEFVNVRDRGYGSERIFMYLSPDASIQNADSYALFAVDLSHSKITSQMRFEQVPKDKFAHCGDPQLHEMQRRFAIAARMITRAQSVIANPSAETQTHFKTANSVKLKPFSNRFNDFGRKLDKAIQFQCDDKCDATVIGYYKRHTSTVHVCPLYFGIASPEDREDELLVTVMMEEFNLDEGLRVGTPAYRKQTTDQARNNPRAFVAYARDVKRSGLA